MEYKFKKIVKDDWNDLLRWRNNPLTHSMSINQNLISNKSHYEYMSKLNLDPLKKQFIFTHNNNKIGTIREDKIDLNIFKLNYSINPDFRNNGYGKLMMYLFLFKRKGTFICEIKPNNISSIKMCQWNNFKLTKTTNSLYIYKIIKP